MAGFADQITDFSEKTKAKLELAVRKIALDVFSEVILMSPVDTGRFRGNWQVAIGNVPAGTIELSEWDKKKVKRKEKSSIRKAKTGEDKSAAIAAQTAGTATISKVQAEVLNLKVGQVIFLINNLPYAIPLEYGHSKQAPAGMVRVAIARWQPIVDAVGRELSKG